jgi:hypothetical protein
MLGLPVLALVIADAATEKALQTGSDMAPAGPVHLLKPGKIAEGLDALRGAAL